MGPLLSQAWQSWKSAKATALLVVVAFTVGIGSATAIYAVIHSQLLKPLPYAHGERFVSLLGGSLNESSSRSSLNLNDVREYRDRMRSFDAFGWMRYIRYNLTAPGEPRFLNGIGVTPALANSLGLNPRLGRWFRDFAEGPVAVISNGLWLRLGSDPAIVGRTITLSGSIYTVTGVMPSLTGLNLPARSVGGDYYDFLELGGDHTGIALADVAGKGIPAALIMSVVQASLRVISSEPDIELPQLAAKMNYFLYRSTGPNSYATFFYAQLDQHTRELRYVNAGHNAPYLLRAGGDSPLEELTTGGTIIGMFPQTRYEEGTLALHTGDVLIVFTDGVTEALNPADEEFGEDRLKDLLRTVGPLPIEEMAARITHELKEWIQDAAQYDDLTFVLMKVK